MQRPWFLPLLACLVARGAALPLYADAAQSSLALVLCTDLDRAVASLRQQPLATHEVGAEWLEGDCVALDPCAQTGAGGLRAPRREWLHANSSALATRASAAGAALAGERAWNFGSLTHARVPEGLVLRACAPNFDVWRRDGALECAEATLVEVDTVAAPRGCPQAAPFTLVECLQPLQRGASALHLHWRPPQEVMHFGHMPLTLACAVPLPPVAALLCNRSRDDFVVDVPKAAAPELAHTSLVWYDFAAGYGCHAPPADDAYFLSRLARPNRVLPCPAVAHGVARRRADDPTGCDVECEAPFVQRGGACVSPCAGLNATCAHAAAHVCTDASGARFFNCSVCAPRPGFATRAFDAQDPRFECAYEACAAGAASPADAHECTPCPVNHVAADAQAAACESCNTSTTGRYSRVAGGLACGECFEAGEPEASPCADGRGLYARFADVLELFALYARERPEILLHEYVERFCAQGYACLPCAPGTVERAGRCEPCGYGEYMPNFGATACFACAEGQNTTARGQNASAACVCTPGFE